MNTHIVLCTLEVDQEHIRKILGYFIQVKACELCTVHSWRLNGVLQSLASNLRNTSIGDPEFLSRMTGTIVSSHLRTL